MCLPISGEDNFITIDLGDITDVNSIRIRPRQYGWKNVEVYLGTDISNLQLATTFTYPGNDNNVRDISLNQTVKSRYLKLVFPKQGNTSKYVDIYEIGVNGSYNTGVSKEYGVSSHDLNSYKYAYRGSRVLTQPFPYYKKNNTGWGDISDFELSNEVVLGFNYDTSWDGFIIQNGRTYIRHQRDGGAGVALRHNGHIKNCIIRNNINKIAFNTRGGGAFQNGGIFENCQFTANKLIKTRDIGVGRNIYGAGIYLRSGTIFNSTFSENYIQPGIGDNPSTEHIEGSAIFFEVAKFYNNTVTDNIGPTAVYSGDYFSYYGLNGSLEIYNTIIAYNKNTGFESKNKELDFTTQASKITVTNCLLENETKHKDISAYPNIKNLFYMTSGTLFKDKERGDYTLHSSSPAINHGTEELGVDFEGNDVKLPAYDANYDARVQDCRVDIGAYEYNGAYAITPDLGTTANTAYYYVTQNGFGTSSAQNPANAACWQKLQKVLDAAGRYKFLNPETKVIVKIAAFPTVDKNDINGYRPLRSTEPSEQDVRLWSIQVPRGVELWGGYPNYTKANDETAFTEEVRDITKNKTYILGSYDTEGTNATAYHVVNFTDYIYDADGLPYKEDQYEDVLNQGKSNYNPALATPYAEAGLLTMADGGITDRATIDGVFITGGKADAAGNSGTGINLNRYGGAAIVTKFGHVRNCIIEDNLASVGGGALYMEEGSIVSGTLMKNNSAAYGGAIYVKQVSDRLASEQYPEEMAQIVTSTIVDNNATTAGGGLWFFNNTRVNSSVFWHNQCADQANVSGQTSSMFTGATQTFRQYPFAYSAVERVRLPGFNNIAVAAGNTDGVRFTEEVFYELDDYSVLCNVGMPNEMYNEIYRDTYGANDYDFTFKDRVTKQSASFIDIGARANNAININTPTKPEQLLLRLYVSAPEDVNFDLVQKMRLSGDAVYSKIGSSFAYPMQHIEDALKYIRDARKSDVPVIGDPSGRPLKDFAANLPFEIVISKGTFYPLTDIFGNHGYSISNTFLIPEGVTIVGGESCEKVTEAMKTALASQTVKDKFPASKMKVYTDDKRTQFFGQHRVSKPAAEWNWNRAFDMETNIVLSPSATVLSNKATGTGGGGTQLAKPYDIQFHDVPVYDNGSGMTGVTMVPVPLDILRQHRAKSDINANGMYEPWEFANQTILSGTVVNVNDNVNSVYHVLTSLADERFVGKLPIIQDDYNKLKTPDGKDYLTLRPGTSDPNYNSYIAGTKAKCMGQPIELDGIEIQDGEAYGYIANNVPEASVFSYYHGGALMVDGNWGSRTLENGTIEQYYHHSTTYQSVAYRDIPVFIRNCTFNNNKAGYGGAISTNSSLYVFGSNFTQNRAISGRDDNVEFLNQTQGQMATATVEYAGVGGCIYASKMLFAVNNLFANNESQDELYNGELHNFKTLRNSTTGKTPPAMRGGAGGAIFGGVNGNIYLFNSDIVRNKATFFPAIYTFNANTLNPTDAAVASKAAKGYNQIVNTIFWGNEASVKRNFADLVINYGQKDATHSYSTSTTTPSYPNLLPQSQDDLDQNFSPTLWFCAYEKGKAASPIYTTDLRNTPYTFGGYIPSMLKTGSTPGTGESDAKGDGSIFQNCNINLSSLNSDLNGPNFSSPSIEAGYAGYMASSDWSLSRLNNLVDNGWGRLDQTITQVVESDGKVHYKASFNKKEDNKTYSGSGAYYSIHYDPDTYFLNDYNSIADRTALGDHNVWDIYMRVANSDTNVSSYRISHDPNPTHRQTYIDMGVYEYIHTELKPETENEVDILWVATEENLDNGEPDGSCWEQPTSDLQRAIETLLASRNGHAKEIRITNGEYSPIYTMGDENLLTFYINTKKLNHQSEIPSGIKTSIDKQNVKSLTISGGWAKEWKMTDPSETNAEEYPAIIRSVPRSGVGTDKLNNVFRIEDARQWYGVDEAKADGSKATLTPTGVSKPTVIPISIDGLTFINKNAVEISGKETQGSAFYYGDQTYDDDKKECQGPLSGELKLSINRSKVVASGCSSAESDFSAMYIGKGGGDALVYNSVFHSNFGDPAVAYNTRFINNTFGLNRGALKLIDSENEVSGLPDVEDQPGTSGGDGPIMLSKGYGREGGAGSNKFTIGSGSVAHNNVFWRNNLKVESTGYTAQLFHGTSLTDLHACLHGKQAEGAQKSMQTEDRFTYNAVTDPLYYNDTDKHELADGRDERNNIGLSLDNSDAIYGPNFQNVALTATETADMEKRDFRLLPSVRLMNSGDNDIYESVVGVNPTETYTKVVTFSGTVTEADGKQHPRDVIYNTTYTTYDKTGKTPSTRTETKTVPWNINLKEGIFKGYESDHAFSNRVIAVTIDRGAYEFQNALTRVIYVDPAHTDGDGTSWDKPYNSLQKAIDLVAVYYNAYDQQAYVFSKEGRMNESIILRDGVTIYGSINKEYKEEADRNNRILASPEAIAGTDTELTNAWTEDNDKLKAFERKVINDRPGLALFSTDSPNRSIINGLQNTLAQYSGTTIIDGFHIHGASTDGLKDIKKPVIELNSNSAKFVIRNCLIRNNEISGDDNQSQPVVHIADQTSALLYNVLLQENKAGQNSAVLSLGSHACAVNVTNVALSGKTLTGSGKVFNSINWSIKDGNTGVPADATNLTKCNTADQGYPFAHYLSTNSIYGKYPFIYYQLEENSPHIDCAEKPAVVAGDAAGFKQWMADAINYQADRDVLGNPRSISTADGSLATAVDKIDRGCFETWRIGNAHTALSNSRAQKTTTIATTKLVTVDIHMADNTDYDKDNNKSIYPLYPQNGSVVYLMPGSDLVLGELQKESDVVTNPLYKVGDVGYCFQPAYFLVKDGASLYAQGCQVDARYIAMERYFKSGRSADDELSYNHLTALPYAFDLKDSRSVTYNTAETGDASQGAKAVNLSNVGVGKVDLSNIYDYNIQDRSKWNYDFQATNSNLWTQRTTSTAAGTEVKPGEGVLLRPSFAEGATEALLRFTASSGDITTYIYNESPTQWYKTVTLTQNDDIESTDGNADFTKRENMGWNLIGIPYIQGHYQMGARTADGKAIYEATQHATPDEETSLPIVKHEASQYQVHVPHTMWLYYNDSDNWGSVNSWDGTKADGTAPADAYLMSGEAFFTQTAAVSDTEDLIFCMPLWFAPTGPAKENEDFITRSLIGTRTGGVIEKPEQIVRHRVWTTRGTIHVDGLTGEEYVTIHSTGGAKVFQRDEAQGHLTHRVSPGVYIVRVNKESHKIIVK